MRILGRILSMGVILSASLIVETTMAAQRTANPVPLGFPLTPTQVSAAAGQEGSQSFAPTTMDEVVERFIAREHGLIKMLEKYRPVAETYLQNLTPDRELGPVPIEDHYFLGRIDMGETVGRADYFGDQNRSLHSRLRNNFQQLYKTQYLPMGLAWMVYPDRTGFDREHYGFRYLRREFLGDLRCLVFDVAPRKHSGRGRFIGRIWVEDEDFNIVRLNGTFVGAPRNSFFFHMDSWRLNLIPDYWVPSYIYSEEGNTTAGIRNEISFKAQTHIWGYAPKKTGDMEEMTEIRAESLRDQSPGAQEASPLQAQRAWEQEADDNVVERLTRAGLLAPEGDVDKILQTVVNNLEITNNIDRPMVRARVLLTAPLETFSMSSTIAISRGLIDVLPDEASLAAVLAHELAHIVLGHNRDGEYAFSDRMLFTDESTYSHLWLKHTPEEESAADQKAVELLRNSPYADKLGNVGLFLKMLQARAPHLSGLVTTSLGDPLVERGTVRRLAALLSQGPSIHMTDLDQMGALPLGGRLKINPWDDSVELVKTAPLALTSGRDKMPFEVTPFYPRLRRFEKIADATAASAAGSK